MSRPTRYTKAITLIVIIKCITYYVTVTKTRCPVPTRDQMVSQYSAVIKERQYVANTYVNNVHTYTS